MKKRICCITIALCIALAAGCSKAADSSAVLPEVRNNGTAIQWKYSNETDWRDLVSLTELRGAAGEAGKDGVNGENGTDGKDGLNGTNGQNGANGKDGINGVDGKDGADGKNGKDGIDGANGKDGINGKSIEVQRATEYIQWRYEGDEWQNLVAIADITGPAGQKGADGANGKTPEFRVSENTLQWRYVGDEVWLNLYDLSVLKGLDGKAGADGKDGINGKDGIDGKDGAAGKDGTNGINGQDGRDGADGNTPFIGENGNWWIGETDTGVKAAGTDGVDGEKGDKGDKGDAGQDGSSPGWFYGVGVVQSVNLQMELAPLYFQGKMSSGGLVSCDGDTVRLSRGHHYQVSVNGAVYAMSNDDKGFYSVRMTDGYDNQLCRDLTSIKVDKGKKLNETRREQHTLSFNRVYDAKGGDIVLRLALEQAEYATYLLSFRGTITVTALD